MIVARNPFNIITMIIIFNTLYSCNIMKLCD